MPIDNLLNLLIAERDKLNRAIEALQGPPRRRGRPPKAAAAVAPAAGRKRRGMSAAARRRQAERMKAFWAARRAKTAKRTTKPHTAAKLNES